MMRRNAERRTSPLPEVDELVQTGEADPRLALVLDQVLRALSQQQGTLDNLRARAGTLVAAASLVSSFFGATALSDKTDPPATIWVVLAFLALFVVIAAAVMIVWPYEWRWGIDGHRLLVARR